MKDTKLAALARRALADGYGPGLVRVVGPAVAADPAAPPIPAAPSIVEVGRGADANAPLMLASVSKLLTGAAVLAAAERGALSLDEPVAPLLSGIVRARLSALPGFEGLSVRRLLNHTSGFGDAYENGRRPLAKRVLDRDFPFTLEEMARWTVRVKPVRVRSRAHYADVNFDLLGAVLEHALDASFDEALAELVTGPLGLESTHPVREGEVVPLISHRGLLLDRPEFTRSSGASGGILSTAADMDRFLRGYFGGELVPLERIRNATGSYRRLQAGMGPVAYGPGVMRTSTRPPFGGREMLGHLGSTGSFAFWVPSRDATIVGTLAAFGAGPRAMRLAMRLAANA